MSHLSNIDILQSFQGSSETPPEDSQHHRKHSDKKKGAATASMGPQSKKPLIKEKTQLSRTRNRSRASRNSSRPKVCKSASERSQLTPNSRRGKGRSSPAKEKDSFIKKRSPEGRRGVPIKDTSRVGGRVQRVGQNSRKSSLSQDGSPKRRLNLNLAESCEVCNRR